MQPTQGRLYIFFTTTTILLLMGCAISCEVSQLDSVPKFARQLIV